MNKKFILLVIIVVSLMAIGSVASQENISDDFISSEPDAEITQEADTGGYNDSLISDSEDSQLKSSDNDSKLRDDGEVISITITKIWDDSEDTSLRPNGVDFVILANGKEATTVYVTKAYAVEDNAWVYTVDDLAKYDSDGNEINYEISEVSVGMYKSEVMKSSNTEFMVVNTLDIPHSSNSTPDSADDSPQEDSYEDSEDSQDDSNSTAGNSNTVKNVTKSTVKKQAPSTNNKNSIVDTKSTGNPLFILIIALIAVVVFVAIYRRK